MTISPRIAAELAKDAYSVHDERLFKAFIARKEFSSDSGKKEKLKAEVGSRIINTIDGFGLCAMGSGIFKNELFLIFRGSTSANYNADWVSNGRIGLTVSNTGLPVHAGFNQIFTSMLPKIKIFLKDIKQIKTVHCIGHSLGGAIATLAADWFKYNKGISVKLYTFGAPKPALAIFSNRLTYNLSKKHIHRVYHATDPVPMIPLFPFVHPPLPGFGHYIPSSESILSKDAHDMEKYMKSVEHLGDWEQLERRKPPFSIETAIEQWLKSKSPISSSSPHVWQWLNESLIYVLKKISYAFFTSVQAGVIGIVTIADTIAYMLRKGIDISEKVGELVLMLMRKIMQALGLPANKPKESFDQRFMRNIMLQLVEKTNEEARKVVRKL